MKVQRRTFDSFDEKNVSGAIRMGDRSEVNFTDSVVLFEGSHALVTEMR